MEGSLLVRDFAILMAVAGVAIVLFQWLRQPPVLGYLIAGLIVGPYTLPLVGLPAPVSNTEGIHLMAELGFIILLFAIGLEFGWRRIRQLGLRVILIGSIEIIFMIALGYEIATLLGWSTMEAIFLGAALSISSSAIIIKVLRDTGVLHEPHGRLIVGILIVEDFAAVILLSLLSGVATSGTANLGEVTTLVVRLGLFLVCTLFMGALVAPHIIRFVARFMSAEVMLIVSLAMCFVLALVGEQLHISAAVGAFIIGTVLGDTEYSEVLNNTIIHVRDIFAALFFVSIGMLIEVVVLSQYIVPALTVAGVFMAGKMFASTLGTFITGPRRQDLAERRHGKATVGRVLAGDEQSRSGPRRSGRVPVSGGRRGVGAHCAVLPVYLPLFGRRGKPVGAEVAALAAPLRGQSVLHPDFVSYSLWHGGRVRQ